MAASTKRRSYSLPKRLTASIAIHSNNTPMHEPANMPREVICQSDEMKHESTVL